MSRNHWAVLAGGGHRVGLARVLAGIGLLGLLAACGSELSALLPQAAEQEAMAEPAVYRDPADADGNAQYIQDANSGELEEIVNGKCLPDHPVTYCTTIDGVFKQPLGALLYNDRERFLRGNRVFNANWVPGPRPNHDKRDGLGPVFDNRSCGGCHINNGRGRPPQSREEPADTMIVRISLAPARGEEEPRPHPKYGTQFNGQAVGALRPEGRLVVTYDEIEGRFADGQPFSLRRPRYDFTDLALGPLGDRAMVSPRIAPQVIGLGLFEALEDEQILARADPDDANGDGISGRANYVTDPEDGERRLGRFGWKAAASTLRMQTAGALRGDMGITSGLYPTAACAEAQSGCREVAGAGAPEIADQDFEDLVFYMQMLSPTGRRNMENPEVARGEALFAAAGCGACHVPEMKNQYHPEIPALSKLVFRPYSDLLLHDMGAGLADNRPEAEADGREWRTPPLWGIGLTKQVGEHAFYLHDGRARNLLEAILWHGGEGARSRDKVALMSRAERDALIRFLGSL